MLDFDRLVRYGQGSGDPGKQHIASIGKYLKELLTTPVKENIIENIVLNATTSVTTARLEYGINVITSATINDYCARLPYPPRKGQSASVVNVSGMPIVIYPSVDGGSINGTLNAPALVPSDGKLYTFVCWENPLPGAWSWTPPATNQYDSGEIYVPSLVTSSQTIAAINNGLYVVGSGTYASSSYGYNGINNPLIYPPVLHNGYPTAFFKPSTKWNSITKIKVYTNLAAASSEVFCRVTSGDMGCYYELGTNIITGNAGSQGSSNPFSALDKTLAQVIPGSLTAGTLAPNIGDPGTVYDEIIPTNSSLPYGSLVGDYYAGQKYDSFSVLRDLWYTRYICFNIRPYQNVTGFKFRFFIEYN